MPVTAKPCYHARLSSNATPPFFMNQEPRREPLNWRQLLKILAAVALLELGFFLFRLGAAWWNAT